MPHGVTNFWVQTHVLHASECSELLRACCLEHLIPTELPFDSGFATHTHICVTRNIVTHHLSHTTLQTQTCNLKLIDPPPPPLSILPSPSGWNSFFPLIGRGWLVGFSGPLISWNGSSTKVALVLRKLISLIAPINLDFRGHDKYQSKGIFCLLDTLTWETHCT